MSHRRRLVARLVHRELFDDRSIVDVGAMFGKPILIGHDDTRPVGRIRLSRSTGRGLEIEADLVGGDEEIEGIRRKLGAGLQAGLSIGFFPDRSADEWRQPATRGGLPLVVRRGVEIRETSLVVWPAYPGAAVDGVFVRTVDGNADMSSRSPRIELIGHEKPDRFTPPLECVNAPEA